MISSINVTPLCDILLVLLILFMVASTYIVAQSLKVELPDASAADGLAGSTALQLTLTREGEVLLNQKKVSESELEVQLRDLARDSKKAELVLSADEQVPHGRVVHFIDMAKRLGIIQFAIQVETVR